MLRMTSDKSTSRKFALFLRGKGERKAHTYDMRISPQRLSASGKIRDHECTDNDDGHIYSDEQQVSPVPLIVNIEAAIIRSQSEYRQHGSDVQSDCRAKEPNAVMGN